MIKDYNLADQALAGLSAPKIGLVTYESTPSLCPSVARKVNQGEKVRLTSFSRERIQRQYNILRKATRYTVDHAMVRHAQLVSMAVTAEELSTMIESAIPPNIPMWILHLNHLFYLKKLGLKKMSELCSKTFYLNIQKKSFKILQNNMNTKLPHPLGVVGRMNKFGISYEDTNLHSEYTLCNLLR